MACKDPGFFFIFTFCHENGKFYHGLFKPQKQQTICKAKIRSGYKKKYFKGEFMYSEFLPSV